jgi:hypothetical protein
MLELHFGPGPICDLDCNHRSIKDHALFCKDVGKEVIDMGICPEGIWKKVDGKPVYL